MLPVLFTVVGVEVQSYGVSKALAAIVAAWLLGRAFTRLGLKADDAHALVMWATIWGFVGGKIYFLLEHANEFTWHHLGGSGFTWYGGLIGGAVAFLVIIGRRKLPATAVIDAAAIPLALAYGIGRIGCWLSGDGTYGKPTDLPWGETYADGIVPTEVPVHPTPLYETLASLAIVAVLLVLRRRVRLPLGLFASYLILSGAARFLVEFLRINDPVVLGLTQPQLWSLLSVAVGVGAVLVGRSRVRRDVRRRDALRQPEAASA